MFIFNSYVCWNNPHKYLNQFDVDLNRKVYFHQYSSQEFSLQLYYENSLIFVLHKCGHSVQCFKKRMFWRCGNYSQQLNSAAPPSHIWPHMEYILNITNGHHLAIISLQFFPPHVLGYNSTVEGHTFHRDQKT